MDKMKLAHEMALAMAADGNVPNENIVTIVWQYADAMQAEADKREDKARPETLCEVDWRVAPVGAYRYEVSSTKSIWLVSDGVYTREVSAPSFGFTGSHIVERPQ